MGRTKGSKNKKKVVIDEYDTIKQTIEEKKKLVDHDLIKEGTKLKFIFAGYQKEGIVKTLNHSKDNVDYFCVSPEGMIYPISKKHVIEILF